MLSVSNFSGKPWNKVEIYWALFASIHIAEWLMNCFRAIFDSLPLTWLYYKWLFDFQHWILQIKELMDFDWQWTAMELWLTTVSWLMLGGLAPSAVDANPDAKRLYDDLLSNYNRLIRPVGNNSDRLTVKMGLRLSQLIDVVTKTLKALVENC